MIIMKYLPVTIALVYFIVSILHCIGISLIIIPNLFYMSPITALFIICASFAFKFCIWHRLPIYYALILQLIAVIDYYSKVNISNSIMLFIYFMLTITFILLGMYFKNKKNGRKIST